MTILDLFADAIAAPAQPTERTSLEHRRPLGQFFTPMWAAEELTHRAIGHLGNVAVLEPSCGEGAFLCAIPSGCDAIGVEIDPVAADIVRRVSGRPVITSAFETADLGTFRPDVVIGNVPFNTGFFDVLLDRAHGFLPADGLIACIIPTHFLQTPSRVQRWSERFSIEIDLLPRTLFPGLSKTIAWARFIKSVKRHHVGLLLFAETSEVEAMRPSMKAAVGGAGTWKETVRLALTSLGGSASVQSLYEVISTDVSEGRTWWREKVRQTLGRHFVSLGNGRWALEP